MKTYKEIAENVFEKRENYYEKKKARNKMIKRSAVAFSALLILFGAAFWQENIKNEVFIPRSSAGNNEVYNGVIISEDEESEMHNGVNIPFAPNSFEEVSKITYKLVESYDGDIETSYVTPKNGEIGFSEPLRQAIEIHKNEAVLYRIYIDLFRNNEQLSHEEMREEMKRLTDMGYTVVEEKYFDGKNYHYSFSLHITNEEIKTLSVSESYGMFLFFYDERVRTE